MEIPLVTNPLVLSFVLVFLAELGDKTQLVAIAFATRYRMGEVLAGAVLGTLAVTGVSVGLGASIGQLFADHWLKIVTGMLLIVFAIVIARESREAEDSTGPRLSGRAGPVIGVAVTFFVAEIGDKTMLATIGIAAQSDAYALVWVGASAGMILANVIGIALGRLAGRKLGERRIRWIAATLFFASGVIIALDGIRSLPTSG